MSQGFIGDPPGDVERSVHALIDAAWNASPLAKSYESAEPPTFPDFAGAVTSILVVMQDAIGILGAEVDDLRARLATLEN
jgi:hypothetical protein